MSVKVLIFGASGFMMAQLLPILQDKYHFELTAFVRPGSKGIPFLSELGVGIIEGEWSDEDLINKTVSKFDIIWESGDSHDVALPAILVPAMLKNAKNTVLIRFTGTGNWITQTGGNADASAREYDDADEDDIKAIHGEMFNGAGDLVFVPALDQLIRSALDALGQGLNVWLLCSGGVYGTPPKGVQSAGVFVRLYTNNAFQLGYAPVIGQGTAQMQLIHMDDVVSATELLLKEVIPTIGHTVDPSIPRSERFWNAPGYSVEWKRIAEVFEDVMSNNLNLSIRVKQVPLEEAGFMGALINADMKSKFSHLEKRGWTPKGPTIDETLGKVLVKGVQLPLP